MKSIVNIKAKPTPAYTLYMGRANKWLNLEQSKWANPFPMKREAERPKCIYDFAAYFIQNTELLSCLHELDGQIGGCYCRPRVCHLDVIHYVYTKHEEAINNLRWFTTHSDANTLFDFMTDWRDINALHIHRLD